MLTLSVVRTDFKKLLKWGAVAIAILITLFILFRIAMVVKNILFPPPPLGPDAAFGQIVEPYYPEGINREFKYEIDTISGNLPEFERLVDVYPMELRGPDILAVQNASNKIERLGFNPNPKQISDFIYTWSNPSPPSQNLTLNIKLNDLKVSSPYFTFEETLKEGDFDNKEEAIGSAEDFLKGAGVYPDDINSDLTKVEFSKLENGTIQPNANPNESNLATVYYFQNARGENEIPIVYPQGPNSSMRVLVGAGKDDNYILDANFTHQNIVDEPTTYTIKTVAQAFEELESGEGVIISYDGNDTNIRIRNVYMAYYFSGQLQDYLVPVAVFEGDNRFIAYVPLITPEWIDN